MWAGVARQRSVQLAQPHLQNATHNLHGRANWRFFKGINIKIMSKTLIPVFDVHPPEVVVEKAVDRRLAKSIFVRHNRSNVIVDKVAVDGVAVDDDGGEGDEGAVDDVLEVVEADAVGRLRLCQCRLRVAGYRWHVVDDGGTPVSLFPSNPGKAAGI